MQSCAARERGVTRLPSLYASTRYPSYFLLVHPPWTMKGLCHERSQHGLKRKWDLHVFHHTLISPPMVHEINTGVLADSVPFEVLDGAFVLRCCVAGLKCSQVPSPSGLWILPPRVQSILSGHEFPNHNLPFPSEPCPLRSQPEPGGTKPPSADRSGIAGRAPPSLRPGVLHA